MKSELVKTGLFVAVALALVAAASWVQPEAARPEMLSDEGEPLFPEFRNISDVKAIEVVGYDEAQAVARPLKVEFRQGRWILPSHNDYPAEAAERLDKTAGALLNLHKDIVVSDRLEDHATYGVIDPLDMKVTSLTGRGKRVTLRNGQGEVLADVVLGKPVPDHPGYRYLRLPGHRRTYAVKTEADPSARFQDWVSGNLLQLSSAQIQKVTINSYSIDETFGRLANVHRVVLTKSGKKWTSEGSAKISSSAIRAAVATLAGIRIVGARPKPELLARQLRNGRLQMTLETVMSLRQRGFFITPAGQLLANEGEMTVETTRGLIYTLKFGEIVRGGTETGIETGAEAGKEAEPVKQDRYLLVMVHARSGGANASGNSSAERLARSLNRRFADWYYVISGADFAKLRLAK